MGVGAGAGETAGPESAGEAGELAEAGAWGAAGSIAKSARAAAVQNRAGSRKIGSNFIVRSSKALRIPQISAKEKRVCQLFGCDMILRIVRRILFWR
jgi:hypothetical protein